MEEVAALLLRVERRLEGLLALGLRQAGQQIGEMAQEADALEALGMVQTAERLRRAIAAGPAELLPALVLARSACRLLRARLAPDAQPVWEWKDALAPAGRSRPPADRWLPVSRMRLQGKEVWACVGVRGQVSRRLVLVHPVSIPGVDAPWLGGILQGAFRWEASHPLGVEQEVSSGFLEGAGWSPFEQGKDPLLGFRRMLAGGKLQDNTPVLDGGGPLRLRVLDRGEVDTYAWLEGEGLENFRCGGEGPVLGLAWVQGAVVVPLGMMDLSELGRGRVYTLGGRRDTEKLRL